MKKLTWTLLLFLLTLYAQAQEDGNHFIPQPLNITYTSGEFNFGPKTQVFIDEAYFADLQPIVSEQIRNDLNWDLTILKGSKKINSNFIAFERVDSNILEPESYVLEISPSWITIKASDYAGMFYGFQTFRQAIPIGFEEDETLPGMLIEDQPRFSWRGVMLDVSRHFQTKEFVLKQIDVISTYKINKFHLHLTDDQGWRIEIKKYPNLTNKGAWRADRGNIPWWERKQASADEPKPIGGFYSHEDLREIVAYAKVRNVDVIPEIDVPAHSKALIAAYPKLFCYDEVPDDVNFEVAVGGKAPDNALCAGKETTYAFLKDVIEEVATLFPSEYLHIGGDECNKSNWKKCPYCQNAMQEHQLENEEELQSYFMQRMHEIVKAQNKTMIAWDEVLSGKGVKGATIMAWRRGLHQPQIQAPKEGYPTIMTSYTYSYISQVQGPTFMEPEGPNVVLPLSKVYSHEPIPAELSEEEVKNVLGNQTCLWAEFTPTESHCEYMLYPRTLASAEVSWSHPENKNWNRFQKALEYAHFNRLERERVNYAKSLYSVYPAYAIDELHNEAIVYLHAEAEGYDIFYTLDGKDPTFHSTKYQGHFKATPKSLLKAGLFDKKGELLGVITEIRLK